MLHFQEGLRCMELAGVKEVTRLRGMKTSDAHRLNETPVFRNFIKVKQLFFQRPPKFSLAQ
jgi:hypothetical protein